MARTGEELILRKILELITVLSLTGLTDAIPWSAQKAIRLTALFVMFFLILTSKNDELPK